MKRLMMIMIGAALCAMAGQAMPRLNSSDFDFKYEFDGVLPSAQDLDGDGCYDFSTTLEGNAAIELGQVNGYAQGYAAFAGRGGNSGEGNCYMISAAASGQPGGVWQRYGVTTATGFTIEMRMMIRSLTVGAGYAFALSASPNSNDHVLLNFTTDRVMWGNTVLTNMNLTSEYHTFRIAKESGTDSGYYVWCDDRIIGSNLGSGANWGKDNRILIGEMGGVYRGSAWVSYLRFTKGGYAPPKEKDMRRDSVEFDHKYEMDQLPANFDKSGTVDNVSSSGGVTHFEFNNAGFYSDTDWNSFSTLARSYGYTIETRAKVISSIGKGIALTSSDGTYYDTMLLLKSDGLAWANDSTITNMVTTDDFHTYRVAKVPDNDKFIFWCDGNLVTSALTDGIVGTPDNRFLFGAIGGTYRGKIEVDYIRYTSGVHYPYVQPKGTTIIVK